MSNMHIPSTQTNRRLVAVKHSKVFTSIITGIHSIIYTTCGLISLIFHPSASSSLRSRLISELDSVKLSGNIGPGTQLPYSITSALISFRILNNKAKIYWFIFSHHQNSIQVGNNVDTEFKTMMLDFCVI